MSAPPTHFVCFEINHPRHAFISSIIYIQQIPTVSVSDSLTRIHLGTIQIKLLKCNSLDPGFFESVKTHTQKPTPKIHPENPIHMYVCIYIYIERERDDWVNSNDSQI